MIDDDELDAVAVESNHTIEIDTFVPRVEMLRSWALKAPPRPADFVQRWSAWTTAFGGANKTKGNPVLAVSNDIGAREYGYAAGVDYRLKPQSTVGFAMADGATNRGLAQGFGGNSDAFQVGAYGICLANHWMLTHRLFFRRPQGQLQRAGL